MNLRKIALDLLDLQEKSGQYSNIAVDNAVRREGLDGKDSRLLSALVYGVIERRITLDFIIDSLSSLPPSKIERTTRNILRMGLYQLIWLDRIPAHAAVSESVSLCNKRSRGFVNALLRGFERKRGDDLAASFGFPQKEQDPIAYLSVTYSYPTILCQKFCNIFGFDKTEAILHAWEKTPPTTLRVNPLKNTREELFAALSARGVDASLTENAPFGIRTFGASPAELGLAEGLCFVQDEASQICVAALGARPGETVLDICACPGSKSFGAALDMNNEGQILSFDLHENKLSLITKGAETLGISIIKTAARDGRDFDPALEGIADRIICDVPCSGFGVVAKKPEIRYKDPADSAALPDIQLAILKNATRYLKVGGTLVYSTCTIFPEENEQNVARFLEGTPDMIPCDFTVGNISSKNGMLTLLPSEHGTDGFFIAKFTRKESAK